MNYRIEELKGFSVIGQTTQLTNSQKSNIEISSEFWKQFNQNLKKGKLSQRGIWEKYAFTRRQDNSLLYICAVPRKEGTPGGFVTIHIQASKYLVFEHIGAMSEIYKTYNKIYREVLPLSGYSRKQIDFLHFEKYDSRFHWNALNSIIEIWVPIE